MRTRKNNIDRSNRQTSVSEDDLDGVLFTHLKKINAEENNREQRIKVRFVNYLAHLGTNKAEELLSLMASESTGKVEPNSSPTVGDVLAKCLDVKQIAISDLSHQLALD